MVRRRTSLPRPEGPFRSWKYNAVRGGAKDPPGLASTPTTPVPNAIPNIIPGLGGADRVAAAVAAAPADQYSHPQHFRHADARSIEICSQGLVRNRARPCRDGPSQRGKRRRGAGRDGQPPGDPALHRPACRRCIARNALRRGFVGAPKSDLQQADIVIVSDRGQREKLEALLPDNPWVKAALGLPGVLRQQPPAPAALPVA